MPSKARAGRLAVEFNKAIQAEFKAPENIDAADIAAAALAVIEGYVGQVEPRLRRAEMLEGVMNHVIEKVLR